MFLTGENDWVQTFQSVFSMIFKYAKPTHANGSKSPQKISFPEYLCLCPADSLPKPPGRGKGRGIRSTAWELEEGDVCRYSQLNFVLDLGSVIVAEHT